MIANNAITRASSGLQVQHPSQVVEVTANLVSGVDQDFSLESPKATVGELCRKVTEKYWADQGLTYFVSNDYAKNIKDKGQIHLLAKVILNGELLKNDVELGHQTQVQVVFSDLIKDTLCVDHLAFDRGLDNRTPLPLKENKEFVLRQVGMNGMSLQYAANHLKADFDVVYKAVSECPYALQYADDTLRSNKEIGLCALKTSTVAFRLLSKTLRSDEEFVWIAVQKCPFSLEDVSDDLKANRRIVLHCVSKLGSMLMHAAEELKADRDLVLIAVENEGLALEYASMNHKNDPEIVLKAVKKNGFALAYASQALRQDRTIVSEAVSHIGMALQYASDDLKNDRDIVTLAVKRHGKFALAHASRELQADPALRALACLQD